MKVYKLIAVAFLAFLSPKSDAQKIATLEVELPVATSGLEIPVSIDLDKVTFLGDSSFALMEVIGRDVRLAVNCQVSQDGQRRLNWIVDTKKNTSKKRTYELLKQAPPVTNMLEATANDGAMTIHSGNAKLLNYYFKTVYPPAGIDTNYKRSGFIHPLWTPHGEELTRIQAPDHYHHYGIWNPWTHVLFEKDTVDFWNIKGHQGTVRFAKFVSQTSGPVYSEFEALQEHVVFHKDGTEKVALNELQTVRVYSPNPYYYVLDIVSRLSCASESPFHILAYRYAGFGWRTTGFWDNNNCEVLTSEGKTRKDTDGSKARWCIVQGSLPGNEYGGAEMMSYPGNYNHPEPMRIWVLNTNQRGDMFANFSPTKDKDWELEPGKTYVLRYRMLVFNGKLSKEMAESAWQYYANPAKVTVKK